MPAAYESQGEETRSWRRSKRTDTCISAIGEPRVANNAYPYADPKSRTSQPVISTWNDRLPDRAKAFEDPACAKRPRRKRVMESQKSTSKSSTSPATDRDLRNNRKANPLAPG